VCPITKWIKIISEGVCTVWFANDVAAVDQPEPRMETFLTGFHQKDQISGIYNQLLS
jgi:hypothetical protein